MNLRKRNQQKAIYKMGKIMGLFCLIFLSSQIFAQTDDTEELANAEKEVVVEHENGFLKNWYVGVNGGATTILATLREKPYSWAVGAIVGKQFNRKIALQASFINGKMHSEGPYGGISLASDVNFRDASLLIKLNLNDVIFTKSPKILNEFYFLGGGGLTFFDTKVTNTADNSFVLGQGWDETGTNKTGSMMTSIVPLGLGLSFNLGKTNQYFLTTEFTYRYSQESKLDGGITTHPGHYTYTSLGFVYVLGKPTFSTQQITAEAIEERAKINVLKQVEDEIAVSVQNEIKPFKDELTNQSNELATQSKLLAENQEQIATVQADIETRINALNESFKEGIVTAELPDGTVETTPVSKMAAGAIPHLTSIYFAFNSLYITPDMEREIAIIAKMMKKSKSLKCEITGNASNVGSPEYNLMLSEKRSQAVANFLVEEFGINKNRLILKSNGLTDPLAKNLHKINRRVDLQLF